MSVAAGMAGLSISTAMAAIFLIASVHAWRGPADYARIVYAYRVLPEWLAQFAAMLLPPLQGAVAVALLVPQTRFLGCLASLALLGCFTAAIAINLARGRDDLECGCGGKIGQKISMGLAVRNVLLFGALGASLAAPGQSLPSAAYVGTAGMASFLVVLYLAANQLMANGKAMPAGAHP